MEKLSLGRQIREARLQLGLTQSELAYQCRLDIRTIQRIESERVIPRSYTIRLISDALKLEIPAERIDTEEKNLQLLREIFERRKKIRIATFIFIMVFMVTIGILAFPSMKLFGMPKHVWSPYFYLIIIIHLIGIVINWRCPGCNSLLGDVFSTKYCSKCGLNLSDEG